MAIVLKFLKVAINEENVQKSSNELNEYTKFSEFKVADFRFAVIFFAFDVGTISYSSFFPNLVILTTKSPSAIAKASIFIL